MLMAKNNQELGHSDTTMNPSSSNVGLGVTQDVLTSLTSERTQPIAGLAGSDFTWAPKHNPGRRPSANHVQLKPSTGSGLLLDNSVSDSWSRNTKPVSQTSVGAVAPTSRSSLTDAVPLGNGANVAAPSAISLNGHRPRASYGSNFANSPALGNYDQAPAVYTKAERPTTIRDQDSTLRQLPSLRASPADERRSWLISNPAPNSPRASESRNNSVPPSRDGLAQYLGNSNANTSNYSIDDAINYASSLLESTRISDPTRGPSSVHPHVITHHVRHPSSATDAQVQQRRSSRQFDHPLLPSQPQSRLYQPSARSPIVDALPAAYNPPSSHQSTPRNAEPRIDDYMNYGLYQPGAQQHPWTSYDRQEFAYHQMRYNQSAPLHQYASTLADPTSQPRLPHSRDNFALPVYRNNVLNDYRNSGRASGRYELRDAIGHVAEFCGDQHGSRFIQAKFATASAEEKNIVFQEILDNSVKLMMDIFGNYVIQRLFDIGDPRQKTELAQSMKGHIVALSQHVYGCRVVQKILECEPIGEILVEHPQTRKRILTNQQAMLIAELSDDVMRCVRDQNGNHVLQKAIERCKPEHIRFIFETFEGQVMTVSQHAFGCRIIQRSLEYCQKPEKDALMAEIQGGMACLVTDNYGNYVVQYVVQFGNEADRRFALDVILSNLETFCKHKFASNVVEVCIKFGGPEFRMQLLERFTAVNKRTQESMAFGLIKDSYGNYVVQRLLDSLAKPDHQKFVDHLYPEVQKAKKTSSGRQLASIEKKMQRFGFNGQQSQSAQHSRAVSAEGTPALTFTSIESSAISSINGDATDGTMTVRKQQL